MQNFGLEDKATFMAATGLSGGFGRTGENACGTLTAGVMVIGLIYGRDKLEKSGESKDYLETMRRSGLLCDRFISEFGSTKCHDIQLKMYGKAWDMRNPDVYQDMRDTFNKDNKCAVVTGRAAELAAEVIFES